MGYLGIISYVLKAVGIGLDGMSQHEQAKQQEKMALLNFQIQEDHFNQQRQTAAMQTAINQQIASNEKAALERNATVLDQQAQVVATVGRENVRRTRDDYARMLAAQRAALAKRGVAADTASPLAVQAAMAEAGQQAADKMNFGTQGEVRALFREADNQRAEGHNAMISIADAQARGGAAKLQAQNALTQANFSLAQQMQEVAMLKRSTWQRVIEGLGELTGGAYQDQQKDKANKTPRSSITNNYYYAQR